MPFALSGCRFAAIPRATTTNTTSAVANGVFSSKEPPFPTPTGQHAMLVKFKSEVGGFTMFGDVARTLLKMMGHSGTIPSAILPEDIPDAIRTLEKALESAPPPKAESAEASEHEREEEPVTLKQRAYPLLEQR